MAEFHYLPLFTDDWVADTIHLTRAERGLYMDFLVLLWRSPQCRVPNDLDWIKRRLLVAADEVTMLEFIIKEFMRTTGNWLYQKRLTAEYEYTRGNSKTNSANAKSGWEKRKRKAAASNPQDDRSDVASNSQDDRIPSRVAPILSYPILSKASSPESPQDLFKRVEDALRSIPEINGHPIAAHPVVGPIVKLAETGIPLTIIVESITAQLRRSGKRRISSWRYFVEGIRQAAQDAEAASTPAAAKPSAKTKPDWKTFTHDQYESAIMSAKRSGKWWDAFGPPDKIPADLLDDELRSIISRSEEVTVSK